MGLPRTDPRLPGADDRTQAQLCVHVFMDGCGAVDVSAAFQINPHAAVAIDAVVAVVDPLNLLMDCCLLGMVVRLPVLPVVVIGIRPELQPSQKPAYAELLMMFFYKSVSL